MTTETSPLSPAGYRFGPYRLDTVTYQLFRHEEFIPLSGKAFDTLLVLVSRRPHLVDKNELMHLVWPDAHVSEDSLTQSISVLRKALGDDSLQPQFIATVPRRGYRFIAHVTEIDRLPELPSADVPQVVVAQSPAIVGPARWWVAGASLRRLSWLGVGAAALGVLVASWGGQPRATQPEQPIRFTVQTPPGTSLASRVALSPDSRYLAFVAREVETGDTHLWVRALDGAEAQRIEGTNGAFRPFWNPNSRFIAFFADGRLKKVGLGGSPPQALASVGYRPSGGAWSSEGVIVFADRISRLYSVTDDGSGMVTPLTTVDHSRGEVGHSAPHFLPDGRGYLFQVESSDAAVAGTYLSTLDSSERVRLLDGQSVGVTFAPPGHLLYLRERLLMAQPFDPARGQLTGAAFALGGNISTTATSLSTSASGLIAFGGDVSAKHLVWFDRQGRELGALQGSTNLTNPVIAPDQRQLVASNSGTWIVDLDRGAPTRIANGNLAIWSPESDGVIFNKRRAPGESELTFLSIHGEEDERSLVRSGEMKLAGDWSRPARTLVYVSSNPETRLDIWTLSEDEGAQPRVFLRTSFNEMQPRISPDGRWLAYASDETGAWEVYVQSFPSPGAKRVISVGGGGEPQWTQNGREIVYLRPDGTVMTVGVSPDGDVLQAQRPRALFKAPVAGDLTQYRNRFTVTADGTRFLVHVADERTREPINVLVNWSTLIE